MAEWVVTKEREAGPRKRSWAGGFVNFSVPVSSKCERFMCSVSSATCSPFFQGEHEAYRKQLRGSVLHSAVCSQCPVGVGTTCVLRALGARALWEKRSQNLWKTVLGSPRQPHVVLLVLAFAICPNKTRTCHPCSGLEAKQKHISCPALTRNRQGRAHYFSSSGRDLFSTVPQARARNQIPGGSSEEGRGRFAASEFELQFCPILDIKVGHICPGLSCE